MVGATIVRDPDRLAAVRRLLLLDAPGKPSFDRLTELAAQLIEAPIALMTLVDIDRQWFVSATGIPDELRQRRQTPLEYSLCQHALRSASPLVAVDARLDPVLRHVKAVTEYGIVAYAGAPLRFEGQPVGTLCVLDREPRQWRPDEIVTLQRLGEIAADELRLHFLDKLAARRKDWTGVVDLRAKRPPW
ncbi:MAG TPA: GAF domain-containing protein [Acidimicrobiales bacterium]|nr:GAF domain-containing protein [Acidimicrobiales bacterium]